MVFKQAIALFGVLTLGSAATIAAASDRQVFAPDAFIALCLSGDVASALTSAEERGDAAVDEEVLYASHQGTYYSLTWKHETLRLVVHESFLMRGSPRPICSIGFAIEDTPLVLAELERHLGPGESTEAHTREWAAQNGQVIQAGSQWAGNAWITLARPLPVATPR